MPSERGLKQKDINKSHKLHVVTIYWSKFVRAKKTGQSDVAVDCLTWRNHNLILYDPENI